MEREGGGLVALVACVVALFAILPLGRLLLAALGDGDLAAHPLDLLDAGLQFLDLVIEQGHRSGPVGWRDEAGLSGHRCARDE